MLTAIVVKGERLLFPILARNSNSLANVRQMDSVVNHLKCWNQKLKSLISDDFF